MGTVITTAITSSTASKSHSESDMFPCRPWLPGPLYAIGRPAPCIEVAWFLVQGSGPRDRVWKAVPCPVSDEPG